MDKELSSGVAMTRSEAIRISLGYQQRRGEIANILRRSDRWFAASGVAAVLGAAALMALPINKEHKLNVVAPAASLVVAGIGLKNCIKDLNTITNILDELTIRNEASEDKTSQKSSQ